MRSTVLTDSAGLQSGPYTDRPKIERGEGDGSLQLTGTALQVLLGLDPRTRLRDINSSSGFQTNFRLKRVYTHTDHTHT